MHVTPPRSSKLRVWRLLRPHWKSLTLALLAVLGGAVADLLRTWFHSQLAVNPWARDGRGRAPTSRATTGAHQNLLM